jgi:hypothetical protein
MNDATVFLLAIAVPVIVAGLVAVALTLLVRDGD